MNKLNRFECLYRAKEKQKSVCYIRYPQNDVSPYRERLISYVAIRIHPSIRRACCQHCKLTGAKTAFKLARFSLALASYLTRWPEYVPDKIAFLLKKIDWASRKVVCRIPNGFANLNWRGDSAVINVRTIRWFNADFRKENGNVCFSNVIEKVQLTCHAVLTLKLCHSKCTTTRVWHGAWWAFCLK